MEVAPLACLHGNPRNPGSVLTHMVFIVDLRQSVHPPEQGCCFAVLVGWGGGGKHGGVGGWHKASVFGCLPLAVPIGLSPLLILTLCGSERVLVVSTGPWMTCPV